MAVSIANILSAAAFVLTLIGACWRMSTIIQRNTDAVVALVYQVLGVCGVVPRVAQDQVTTIISMVINILCLLGIVVDPTTAGFGDSIRALSYDKPRKEG